VGHFHKQQVRLKYSWRDFQPRAPRGIRSTSSCPEPLDLYTPWHQLGTILQPLPPIYLSIAFHTNYHTLSTPIHLISPAISPKSLDLPLQLEPCISALGTNSPPALIEPTTMGDKQRIWTTPISDLERTLLLYYYTETHVDMWGC